MNLKEFDKVRNPYDSNTRHYHTWEHIEYMYETFIHYPFFSSFQHTPTNVDMLLEAIVWHDYFLNLGRARLSSKSDEVISAESMYVMTDEKFSEKQRSTIATAIKDTQDHIPTKDNIISPILIDLDLWILGEDPVNYMDYLLKIRKEYKNFSNEEFIEGRVNWLEKMLARDNLFWTPIGQNIREVIAFINLENERDLLVR